MIPPHIANKVLFNFDRTCCVCRNKEKDVQIHHLDKNESNNKIENLAVLCFECHSEAHKSGGFGRKLNANQIKLYMEDWLDLVKDKRIPSENCKIKIGEINFEGISKKDANRMIEKAFEKCINPFIPNKIDKELEKKFSEIKKDVVNITYEKTSDYEKEFSELLNNPELYFKLGNGFFYDKKYEIAVECFNKSLKINPNDISIEDFD